jgi:hypothetical protein
LIRAVQARKVHFSFSFTVSQLFPWLSILLAL